MFTPEGVAAAVVALEALGAGVVDLVSALKAKAQQVLMPADYAALEASWQADVEESAKNAGIAPEPDAP